jgi:hypothetical protein
VSAQILIVTVRERPDVWERAGDLDAGVWPEYNRHGNVLNRYWGRLDQEFADYQFVLYDEQADELLAQGHTVPFCWDGTPGGLPDGIDGLIRDAFALQAQGGQADALAALAVEIPPSKQSRGLSQVMLNGMREIAGRHGLVELVAPVRPNWKERYPLTPIEQYAVWTTPEGLPFDPWMRVHARLGATIVKPEPRSLVISADIPSWESWTEMTFPETGDYVFPHGLSTLRIDRETNQGTYYEPNVWMRHPTPAS